ncbi:prepilin-type N-terminal cleavage/methylation domain-containing protein [Clostridium beijerinckii]|uniref:Prepilin-type N-terminal cleavage/methylation domain-containing protein n=1 Tax=Clostridium beijerinckii TaxID=1520 RepID=A0A7X9XMF0_CLOBE|nr:prepilin-type N-terminal cleavage/methylation domain-containing protein [Clostridium beijerinckii]NMF03347.1 prepilin-type N-terminal cleavage/methylation domain-containing protein [Clostridium beijerinckii]
MKNIKNSKQKKHGFTLVELIIVIAIIAILAAIAIPKFGEMRQTANVKADIATAKNIATIVAADIADNKIKVGQTDTAITELAPVTGTTDVDITKDLDGGTATAKVAETGGSDYTVTITDEGNVTVKIGGVEVYPSASGSTNHK